MLKLNINPVEVYNEITEEFVTTPGLKLRLEHSLHTISKWESRWLKSFMNTIDKTDEELLDYIICMDTTETLTMDAVCQITKSDLNRILTYINSSMTATTFSKVEKEKNKEIITSELIYYWMIALQIPLECEHWHINRLMTLIKICNIKNSPNKKQNKQTAMTNQRELNKQRRMQQNSTG